MANPTKGPRILVIDPGYDAFGYAIFDVGRYLERPVMNLESALGACTEADVIDPEPKEPAARRLRTIETQAAYLAWQNHVVGAYVETPAIAGMYARHNEAQREGVNKLYMSIGVILCGVQRGLSALAHDDAQIIQVPASTRPKVGGFGEAPGKHDLLELTAKEIGFELPRGERGGKKEDAWDAIWLGCEVLGNRVLHDLPAELLDR